MLAHGGTVCATAMSVNYSSNSCTVDELIVFWPSNSEVTCVYIIKRQSYIYMLSEMFRDQCVWIWIRAREAILSYVVGRSPRQRPVFSCLCRQRKNLLEVCRHQTVFRTMIWVMWDMYSVRPLKSRTLTTLGPNDIAIWCQILDPTAAVHTPYSCVMTYNDV